MSEVIIERSTRAGDGIAYAGRQALRTREERALRLYEKFGHEIEQLSADTFLVPSQDGSTAYRVRYPVGEGEQEWCSCPSFSHRPSVPCKHILCALIRVSKRRAQRRRNFLAALVEEGRGG